MPNAKTFLVDPMDPANRMYDCGQDTFWFYHKESSPTDGPSLYANIVNRAVSSIEVWDPYFNISSGKSDQQIFAGIGDDVTIKILTQKSINSVHGVTYLRDIMSAFRLLLPSSKNTRIALRAIDTSDHHQRNWRFHDRFLIIDGTDVYNIGSSIGWHLEAEQSTGMVRIDNTHTRTFIRSIFQVYWQEAESNQIPIQYLHS